MYLILLFNNQLLHFTATKNHVKSHFQLKNCGKLLFWFHYRLLIRNRMKKQKNVHFLDIFLMFFKKLKVGCNNCNFDFSFFKSVIFHRSKNYLRSLINSFCYHFCGLLNFIQSYILARSIKQNSFCSLN